MAQHLLSGILVITWLAASLWTTAEAQESSPSVSSLLAKYSFRYADSRRRLPKYLREASGLAATVEQTVLLHHDNSGLVWRFNPTLGKLESILAHSQPVKGDFEGIANFGHDALLSTSHATLLRFTPAHQDAESNARWIELPFKGLCNFEGLASIERETNPRTAVLLLPCKYPKFTEAGLAPPEDSLVYIFRHLYLDVEDDVEDDAEKSGASESRAEMSRLEIDVTPILRDFRMRRLRPSAIEVVEDHLFILAGKERVVFETDLEGKLLDWRRLSWPRHRQAEGMTLLDDGTLIIADEGRWLGGTLTLYRPNQ